MKKYIYIFSILLVLIPIISCEDILEKKPLSEYSDKSVWVDLSLMETFVTSIYNNIPHGFTECMMSSITDESILTYDGGSSNVTKSVIVPSDISIFGQNNNIFRRQYRTAWIWSYKNIRACNLFLKQVEEHTYSDEGLKNRLTGEVLFLRAYIYQNLVSLYGGVPIITTAYELDDDFLVARNTFEDCINFIADECDKAVALLPLEHTSAALGRATKGAALALKSRIHLLAASDLFHNQSLWSEGYANPELIGYVGGDRMDYWTKAKNSAKAVMDLNKYDLFLETPSPGDDVAKNYEKIFLTKVTSEDIFVRFFSQKTGEGYYPNRHNNSNAFNGYAGNTPTSQMVDAFEMSDGSKFDWNNPVHMADPYLNREPRFYADIAYNGALWRQRMAAAVPLDPLGVIQVGYYQQEDGSWNGGLDTRDSPIATKEDGTFTGYYIRKLIDYTVDPEFLKQEVPWRFIRYAEVLLNYAEACNELGEDVEALQYINIIRHRAGLPDINYTGNELRERIRHERRIELMYEDQRYFDIRRWMIASQVFSTNARGVDIKYYFGATKPTYTFKDVRTWVWNDWSYLMPIQLDEMNRNNLLIQNPLY